MGKSIVYWMSSIVIFLFVFSENLRMTVFGNLSATVEEIKLKYVALLFACCILYANYNRNPFSREAFFPESKWFVLPVLSFAFFTIIFQLENGYMPLSLIEFLFIITPFVFVSFIVASDKKSVPSIIDTSFYIVSICFILNAIERILKGGGIEFDFSMSRSSFESELCPYFVYFEIYYLFKGKKKKSFLCVLFTLLTLKRLCVIKAISFFIIFSYMNYKKVNNKIYYATILFFILVPFALLAFYSGYGVDTIEKYFHRDIDDLMMSRYALVRHVIFSSMNENHGLGSTIAILSQNLGADDMRNSIHCDILRIYLEGTFITTIIYTLSYFKMVKNYNIFAFLIIFHLFSEGIFNHWMLGAGVTCQWIIIYLCLYDINRTISKEDLYSLKKKKLQFYVRFLLKNNRKYVKLYYRKRLC